MICAHVYFEDPFDDFEVLFCIPVAENIPFAIPQGCSCAASDIVFVPTKAAVALRELGLVVLAKGFLKLRRSIIGDSFLLSGRGRGVWT